MYSPPHFEIRDAEEIRLFIAKANRQWKRWASSSKVQVIFHGPHTYISPRIYKGAFNVPTWNYTAVSVMGSITVLNALPEQKQFIDHLVAQFPSYFPFLRILFSAYDCLPRTPSLF